MTVLVAIAAGFAAGALAVALLWRYLVETRAARLLQLWRAEGDRRAVLRAVDAHRAGIKVELGIELAELLPAFPFEPADVRFLGHPAQFVVFAGHTAVKDRRQSEMAEVVFVTLRSAGGALEDERLLDECIRAGRVRWATLRVDTRPPDPAPATALGPAHGPDTNPTSGKSALAEPGLFRDGRRR
jgi:predicted Holliday junction resolvase-like endonuclease